MMIDLLTINETIVILIGVIPVPYGEVFTFQDAESASLLDPDINKSGQR